MQPQSILNFWFEELTAKQHFVKDAALHETIRAIWRHTGGGGPGVSCFRGTRRLRSGGWRSSSGDKVPSSKLAQKFGLKTAQLLDRATELGYLSQQGDKHALTAKGEQAGVEFVAKSRFGPYFLWPQDLALN